MNKELEVIRKHPGFYITDPEKPFTCLAAFFNGYEHGFLSANYGGPKPEVFVPQDFSKFVTKRFGKRWPAGGKGWSTFINENSSSEKEAYELFFTLREEYDRKFKTRSGHAV